MKPKAYTDIVVDIRNAYKAYLAWKYTGTLDKPMWLRDRISYSSYTGWLRLEIGIKGVPGCIRVDQGDVVVLKENEDTGFPLTVLRDTDKDDWYGEYRLVEGIWYDVNYLAPGPGDLIVLTAMKGRSLSIETGTSVTPEKVLAWRRLLKKF